MKRNTVIVMLRGTGAPVVRGNFKKLCLEFGLPYHSLKMRPLPTVYKDMEIWRIEFK